MTGKEQRLLMDNAIKEITVPFFKQQGFKGFYPHFRRIKDDRINLLTFQFNKNGGSFVVEISNCSPNGVIMPWGLMIKPSACNAHHMYQRFRIGSITNGGDYWFDFSKNSLFGNV